MKFNETTIRILARKDYGTCFDFYKDKIGLFPVFGDRNGPYTSFTVKEGQSPCFAIFNGANMSMAKGYDQPKENAQSDTIIAVVPSDDLDKDYQQLKQAGVNFLGEPQFIKEWGMRFVCFRDPEGNLFELNDASGV